MLSRRRLIGTVACVVTIALGLAGCGSSSKNTAGGTTNTTTGNKATGSPLVVGLICSCSGNPLANNLSERVYQAFVSWANDNGGIEGHPIQLITENDNFVPATSISEVHTLVADHIVALVDESQFDITWASYIQSTGIPVIGAQTASEPFFQNPDFFAEAMTEDALFTAVISTGKSQGAKTIGELYCAESVICQQGIAPFKAAGQALGVSVPLFASISATAPSYASQCIAAQQAHVDALYVADASTVIARVAQNCTQQGYKPMYLIDGESLSPFLPTTPGISENLAAPVPGLPYFATDQPVVKTMVDALNKYAPGLQSDPNYNEVVSEAWPAGIMLQAAAKAGGLTSSTTPTATLLQNGLHSFNGETLGGWAPPLTFKAGQPNPVHCWFVSALKNGVYSMPQGQTPQCMK